MRALINAALNTAAVPASTDTAAAFHGALFGYAPRPVRQLDTIASDLGVAAVLVKDESTRLAAFKILGASSAVERALREEPAVGIVVSASAGNHGRAVAHAAALRGLACRVFLPERAIAVRRRAIAAEGAEVVVVNGTYEDAVKAATRAASEDATALIADVEEMGPAEWVIDGYATLFDEAAEQAAYDLTLVPVGVGSLAAGRRQARRAGGRAGHRRRTDHCRLPQRLARTGRADAGIDDRNHNGRSRLRRSLPRGLAEPPPRDNRYRHHRRHRG
jgi:diaminopropionate ammonia-lyase